MFHYKKIVLINPNKQFQEGFERGCKEKNVPCASIASRDCIFVLDTNEQKLVYKDKNLPTDTTLFFIRKRGDDKHFVTLIAEFLNLKKVYVNGLVNTEHTHNEGKAMQMLRLSCAGLPIPRTVLCTAHSYQENQKTIAKEISFPCVIKQYGDRGIAVWKVDSEDELVKKLQNRPLQLCLVQKYIHNTHDFRITMFNGEILGVIKRISKDGFYNNYSRGAGYEVSVVTQEEKRISQKACEITGIDLAGVDIVRDGKKFFIFEVNKTPQINKKYPEEIAKKIIEQNFNH